VAKRDQVVVDVNTILALAAAAEQEIQQLQAILAQLDDIRRSLEAAKETVKAVSESQEPFLVPADGGRGNVFFYATAAEKDKFLVHLGTGVYAKLSREKTLEYIDKSLEAIDKDIEATTKRLEEAMARYQQIQALLAQVQAQARRQ